MIMIFPDSNTSIASNEEPMAPPRALPASWYSSVPMYELERRSIFSKKWLMVTHRLRFSKPGDYVRFQEAGFAFFLCLNRQGELNGFHNVCRHRAFPVVTSESGTANILACKYHGWSYGLNGKLAKAPRFETVPTFDKSSNNLYPVHTHIDAMGFVWVNLEAAEVPSISWREDFDKVDLQPRYSQFDAKKYRFDHTWSMIGDYNWKTLADNYNECYHCSVAHPGVAAISDLSAYSVDTVGGHIQHFSKAKLGEANGAVASTFLFPNASITFTADFFYIMRAVPTSATTTSMEYEVYRSIEASDEAFETIDSLFKQVLKEDKELCNNAQRNLNAGVFTNGQLHPSKEKGPLYFQKLVKSAVMEHRAEETRVGDQVWPARPLVDQSTNLEEEIKFCAGLNCEEGVSGKLAW